MPDRVHHEDRRQAGHEGAGDRERQEIARNDLAAPGRCRERERDDRSHRGDDDGPSLHVAAPLKSHPQGDRHRSEECPGDDAVQRGHACLLQGCDRAENDLGRQRRVRGIGELVRVVADPVPAWHEHHRGRDAVGDTHRVVRGA
jgi:hypothetical protein